MKVAKHFRWEAAHRLPWHDGACRNVHGHSYRMVVSLRGVPDARGLLVDFKDLGRLLQPLVAAWDHATLVAADDAALRAAVEGLGTKHYVLPFDTTSENLCRYVADYLCREGGARLRRHGVTAVGVRLRETETCYAELEVPLTTEAAATRTTIPETQYA